MVVCQVGRNGRRIKPGANRFNGATMKLSDRPLPERGMRTKTNRGKRPPKK